MLVTVMPEECGELGRPECTESARLGGRTSGSRAGVPRPVRGLDIALRTTNRAGRRPRRIDAVGTAGGAPTTTGDPGHDP